MIYETSVSEYESVVGTLAGNTASTPYDVLITDASGSNVSSLKTAIQNSARYINLTFSTMTSFTNLNQAFYGATYIVGCDFTGIVYSGTSLSDTFGQCTSLKKIVLPRMLALRNMISTFAGCSSLQDVIINDAPQLSDVRYPFSGCNAMKKVYFVNPSADLLAVFIMNGEDGDFNATSLNTISITHTDRFSISGLSLNFSAFRNLTQLILDYNGLSEKYSLGSLTIPSSGLLESLIVNNCSVGTFTCSGTLGRLENIDLKKTTETLLNAIWNKTTKSKVRNIYIDYTPLTTFNLNGLSLEVFSANNCGLTSLNWGSTWTKYESSSSMISVHTSWNDTYALKMFLANNNLTSVAFGCKISKTTSAYWPTYTYPSEIDLSGNANLTDVKVLSYSFESASIGQNPLSQIDGKQYLNLIKNLNLAGTGFTSFSLNYGSTVMESLDLSGSAVETVEFNGDFTVLSSLKLANCSSLSSVNGLANLVALTDWSGLFSNSGLTTTPIIPDFVTSLNGTFKNCGSLTTVQNIPDSVTDLEECFYGCSRLTAINGWMLDVSSIESGNMDDCFAGCSVLTTISTPMPIDTESLTWHLLHLKAEPNVGQKLYVYNTNGVLEKTVDNISGAITLQTKSAELCLTDENISDAKRIEFQNSGYHYDNQGLDPLAKNFVLWKDPQSKFKSNIDFGGGGGGGGNGEPVPIGTLCSFNKDEAPSENWLRCDGSAFDPGSYPALRTYLGKDTLPVEYDLENPNKEEVGKEIFVGEINGPDGNMRKVYQLTVTDNVDRSGGNWFDFTSNFSPYLAPSEVDYFVDGGRLSHFLHSGDGYQEAATYESMVTVDKAKTIFRVYLVYQNYAMDYSDERGQNTDKYFTVRYTRTDDSQAKATIKYKYIRAVSGIDQGENEYLFTFLNNLREQLQGYAVQPIGSTMSSISGVAPAGYLKADGSTFDTEEYPLLSAMLGGSNILPKMPDIDNSACALNEVKFAGFFLDEPMYKVVISHNISMSSSTWYEIRPASWVESMDMKSVVHSFMSDHYDTGAYNHGASPANMHIGESNRSLYIHPTGMATRASTWYVTIYFTKNNPPPIPYKFIKAISGVDETESSELVEYIKGLTDKVAYNTMPLGNIITLGNNSFVPAGYLEADGSQFDTEQYPLLYQYLESDRLPNLYDRNSLATTPDISLDTRAHTNYNPSAVYVPRGDWGTYLNNLGITSIGDGFAEDGELHFFGYYWRYIWIQHLDGSITGMQIPFTGERSEWYTFPIKKGEKLYGINTNGSATPTPIATFDIPDYARMNIYYYHKHQYIKAITGLEENTQEVSEITTQIEALSAKVAYNTLPVGNIIELARNTIVPSGYLPCDGSTFDQNEYPLLYHYLGDSNVLPSIYNIDTAFGKQDVGLSTRSDYNPAGVTYTSNMGTTLTDMGLRTDGAGFPADGFLFIETYHWYNLWIEDPDGTKHGYMVASRDDTQSTLWLPIKKGQKLYGWTRNGSGTPMPSTEWVQSTYTKLYIWYAKNYKYIKAVSGVEDESEEASTIVSQMQTMIDRMAYNCQPVGHTMCMANNTFRPQGYLLADGSEFDAEEYPLLYQYLGSNKLPMLYSNKTSLSPDWFKTNTASYNGTADIVPANAANQQYLFPDAAQYDGLMTIHTDDWCYLHITHADGTKDTYMIGIRDNECTSFTIEIKKGDVFCTNRTLTDYTTWAYYEYFIVAIWYYKEFQYIKAVSGLEENSQEASGIATQINALVDKVAYNTLPVGASVSMTTNRITPSGYLLADGRDTTGTSEELETKYPLLYAYLGNSNILPSLHTNDVDKTPDWFKTNYTNYAGTADVIVADAAHQYQLFPFEAEYDGVLSLKCDDWCYLHITHADGTQDTYTIGDRDNADGSVTWQIKKGDVFHMNRNATDYTTWAYYECTTVAIWYYKVYKYIKAVSGIEDESAESTEVVNAINTATAELKDVLLPTTSGNVPGYIWID